VPLPDEKPEDALWRDLPDAKGASLFLDRLSQSQPRVCRRVLNEPALLSDLLALAAWSPLLGTTLEQSPDYITWLNRERLNTRVRTPDELKESLARFALTNSSLNPQVLLARFRRRELLRVYLHDVRRAHTIVETTEELSNLADAILDYALSLARQDLDNKYGAPQFTAERGRDATAEFCIVALGKLGSYELNYASDIDLLFLYSEDGNTSGRGTRGEVTNREYFIKLAEAVTRLVGQQTGEGAAYRVDLRLRPFGRDGALASSLTEAVRYYREAAQQWELQALIRSRAAAGSATLYARFAQSVRRNVFRTALPVAEALASVRIAKQKIDRQQEHQARGFNVKLGRGGIREIEFIAQALQLAHGGRDHWLRAPHTLIILGRLADRDLITEQEHTELSDAYAFLRRLEHRLQMEHGLQTHSVPAAGAQRELVARRMNFSGTGALPEFDQALTWQSENVHRAYERIFDSSDESSSPNVAGPTQNDDETLRLSRKGRPVDAETAAAYAAASVFALHIVADAPSARSAGVQAISHVLERTATESLDRHRALMLTARIASSLDKAADSIRISDGNLISLVRLCGASEFFADMIAANPSLIVSLDEMPLLERDYRAILRAAIDTEDNFADELSRLRLTWSSLLLEIGRADAAGEISLFESNKLQTRLAVASINAAYLIARRELARRFGKLAGGPRLSILGLGRLASGGVDYGSDLDIIFIYDSVVRSPVASLTQDEAYALLGELIISALSSITRTGHLYHVDLRLRPDGNDGPLVSGSQAFLEYLKERAAVWEWLAYVKIRAIAGDLELGRVIEQQARAIIHEAARDYDKGELRGETRRVRDRLQQEQVKPGRRTGLDVKHGPGGMLDVYFATRYLQLRDHIPDEGDNRSTIATLKRLRAAGSLSQEDYDRFQRGYLLLRNVDHEQRVLRGRAARLPLAEHPSTRSIARKLHYESFASLSEALIEQMGEIRSAYERITKP
jgi:[glutamine synthetase] adenylyltransferase / [glutamine synthetase]-adenylyl-L-tyrosine phosphorylase